jgi:hypothetical protein
MLQLKKAQRNILLNSQNECKSFDENYLIHWRGFVISNKTNKILKPGKSKNGYYTVSLNGKSYNIHKLVANLFIPNNDKSLIINHKDGNKLNNHYSNLEWVTYSYNNSHAFKLGLNRTIKENPNCRKKVIDIKTGKIYNSLKEAAIFNNVSVQTLSRWLLNIHPNKTSLLYL